MTDPVVPPPAHSYAGVIINWLIAIAGSGSLYLATEHHDAIAPDLTTAQSNGILGICGFLLMATVHWLSHHGIFDLVGQLAAAWLKDRIQKLKPTNE